MTLVELWFDPALEGVDSSAVAREEKVVADPAARLHQLCGRHVGNVYEQGRRKVDEPPTAIGHVFKQGIDRQRERAHANVYVAFRIEPCKQAWVCPGRARARHAASDTRRRQQLVTDLEVTAQGVGVADRANLGQRAVVACQDYAGKRNKPGRW